MIEKQNALPNEVVYLKRQNERLTEGIVILKSTIVACSMEIEKPTFRGEGKGYSFPKDWKLVLEKEIKYVKKDFSSFIRGKRKLHALLEIQK